ncbi:N-acetylmuramic acid 6-phosphate etherase [Tamaricihabitans halophyticus]|uniref:N-acetylmuramic acid 6-phosphate etherase n=1 Tax=Tamaricihabitans halophyticus TaxID=1262583 RepID=A0A4R2R4Z1_9PSEU|nr:N-acetylmuramic acid 6-phosphate etherase [Tamaricihabitans halophyticus]TCP56859.1 N-acetylmuramic acid 6-phosphate etherase [Tamaricihabitans halophyticus]
MTVPRKAVYVDSPTEIRNSRTFDIDELSTEDILRKLSDEDRLVPSAVAAVLGELAVAVDLATEALRGGGRVHYIGAGTSGRLASLDAAELAPTFNVPDDWFHAHHAGGRNALASAVEGAEDNAEAGAATMREHVRAGDFVLGLTASGRTPYVLGALRTARELGARTGLVFGNPRLRDSLDAEVDVLIAPDTGPEAIAGSTRMKAGTAQKLILTSFSTAVMIKLGRTYSNLMVSVRATNEKLRGRTQRILAEATGLPIEECAATLEDAGGDLKLALVQLLSGVELRQADIALHEADGHVREALDWLNSTPSQTR